MGIDKRKAFVEFTERDLVCITTPFRQKTINVVKANTAGKYINLHTLDLFVPPKNKENPPFYAMPTLVEEDEKGNKEIRLVVIAKVSEDNERIIGEMDVGDEQLFKVAVVEN